MANLTVVIDDAVLRRARIRALEQGTSVNAVVREQLTSYADAESEARAAIEQFLELIRAEEPSSGAAGRAWSRHELHDR